MDSEFHFLSTFKSATPKRRLAHTNQMVHPENRLVHTRQTQGICMEKPNHDMISALQTRQALHLTARPTQCWAERSDTKSGKCEKIMKGSRSRVGGLSVEERFRYCHLIAELPKYTLLQAVTIRKDWGRSNHKTHSTLSSKHITAPLGLMDSYPFS